MASSTRAAVRLVAILGCAFSLAITTTKADTARFTGGPQGVVKSAKGELLEGIMVQLIARKNAVRTTVYSNADGRYAFPALEAGAYTLRIARPREFHPFVKEGVDIKGATPLADIVLDYVTDQDTLPPLPEIMAQMTGSEWLLSLAGAGEAEQPFRSGHLRHDFGERRQRVLGGGGVEHDVGERRCSFDIDALLHERMKLPRSRDAQRVSPGLQGGKCIPAIGIAVDGGAHRVLPGDELYHDAFEQFALGGFHYALWAAGEARGVGFRGCDRQRKRTSQDCDQPNSSACTCRHDVLLMKSSAPDSAD